MTLMSFTHMHKIWKILGTVLEKRQKTTTQADGRMEGIVNGSEDGQTGVNA